MAEKRAIKVIVERAARLAGSWLLLATACLALTQAPRSTYDPAQQGTPQKQHQGFVDFTLQRINPSDKDYGRCLEEGRTIILEETVLNGYFWSNLVSLSLLSCMFVVVVYQHRQRVRREWALSETLQQYEHALSRANAQVDEATERNYELVEALTAARENTLRLPMIPLNQREAAEPSSNAKRTAEAVEVAPAKTSVASAAPKVARGSGNGIGTGNQMGLFKPDVDLILKVNSLEQQLERSQEQEKQLRRQLTQSDQRLQTEQQKNRSLKGA
jgi:hypothetical protein